MRCPRPSREGGCAVKKFGVVVATAVLAASLVGCSQLPVSGDSQAQAGDEGTQQADSYEDGIAWRFYSGSGGDDTREIVCWGDSMTQGVGADTDADALVSLADGELYDTSAQSYPQVLSQLTGLDTYNFGVAGATSEEIAVMQGGLPWTEIEVADDGDEPEDPQKMPRPRTTTSLRMTETSLKPRPRPRLMTRVETTRQTNKASRSSAT